MTQATVPAPMKPGWVLLVIAGAALAGCAEGGSANPNLSAPKLVLHARAEGEVAVFIHGAFAERLYEWMSLRVDNETVLNRTVVFSLEHAIPSTGFFFEASAGTARESYGLSGRVDLLPASERVEVSFLDEDGEWSDAQSFGLPFERVLVRGSAS